jgi:beta-1,4-mannosyl-glycoprotein beta-1,4-N-acetylglucosaminyltransferase
MECVISEKKPTICLNMIVKDEAHIIKDTLTKLCDKIKFSYWVICDTGSTDGTQEIIEEFFKDKQIPGEMFCDEWKNFAHNRSLAISRAYKKTDLALIFDADDEIVGNINMPSEVSHDEYHLQFGSIQGISYTRVLLVNNQKAFEYKSVIHEYITCKEEGSRSFVIEGDYYVVSGRSSSRNKDSEKYLKDALILEKAYEEAIACDDQLYHRYAFYCANSYKDFGKPEEANKWYKIVLNHEKQWPQEKYMACLHIYEGCCKLNRAEEGFFYLVKSFSYDTERVECLYHLIIHYCLSGSNETAYAYYSLFQNFYENNYLQSNMKHKLFIQNDKYDFLLPYYVILICDKVKEKYEPARKSISKMFQIIFQKKIHINNTQLIANLMYNLQFFIENAVNHIDNFAQLFQSYVCFLENSNINLSGYDFLEKYEKYGIVFKHRALVQNQKFTKEECLNSKKILIYAGFCDVHWNYTYSLTNALGGSETAVYNLAKSFPKHYEIYIGGHVQEEHVDNIHFISLHNLENITKNNAFHTLIVSRYTGFYEMFPETSFYKSFIWAHDIMLNSWGCNLDISTLLKKWSNKIDGCICQTEWHVNLFKTTHPELEGKLYAINNGIETKKFEFNNKKISNRFVYSSCPERGLEKVLELWPSILKELPDAELIICSYNKFPKNDHEKTLEKIIKCNTSIKHVGCLSKTELYSLMYSSEYWLYPTGWPETSCITAMEMLASEVICIYYPIAGLTNTLGDYGIPIGQGEELTTIISLTNDNDKKNQIRARGKEYAITCDWKNRAVEWCKLLELNKKSKWVFYYNNFIIQPITQYISNIADDECETFLVNDKETIKKLNPEKITIILNNYMNDNYDCISDKNIFTEFENKEISFLQLEPLNLPHRIESIKQTFNLDNKYFNYKIYDYSLSNIKILNENGINNTQHLPYKVIESERDFLTKINMETTKEYDFGFIDKRGSLPITPPRRNKLLEFIVNQGFTLKIVSGWGEDRDRELAKCRMILNIHGQINENPNPSQNESSNIFEHIRCNRLLESGFKILSEESLYLDQTFIDTYPNLKIIKYSDFFNLNTYEKFKLSKSSKIVDCFTFYNELDLLNYRLNVLDEVVDYFVLVEANQSHSGKNKKLFFDENKSLFEKFNDKIIHIVVDLPLSNEQIVSEKADQWINERFQRNAISNGVAKLSLNDKDLIIISDLDEIPDPQTLEKLKNDAQGISIRKFEQDFYYYNLNSRRNEKWYHSKILSYKKYKELNTTCDSIRFTNCEKIEDGGWHLSYFGTSDFVKNKLENFAHQEYNSNIYTNVNDIKYKIENCIDLFNREGNNDMRKIEITDNKYLPPKYDTYLKKFYKEEISFERSKKYCFIHSCNLENSKTEKLDYLVKMLNSSGLINELDLVYINNIGIPIENTHVQNYGKYAYKYQINNYSEDPLLFETPTINKIINFSIENPNSFILYLHTKGVTHASDNSKIADWVDMMLYFLVEKYSVCFNNLTNGYNAVGCNLRSDEAKDIPLHFSGNFWWSNSNYLKDLVTGSSSKPNCEFVLFSNMPRYLELHDSKMDHYHFNYPRISYTNDNKIDTMNVYDSKKRIFISGGNQFGLGNCLFQIATAIYYCEKHGYTLFLDGNSVSLKGGTANMYNRKKQSESYFNTIFKNLNKECKLLDYKTTIFNNYTDTICSPSNNILIDGYCQNINLFYDVKDKLINYLNFNNFEMNSYVKSKYNINKDDINVMIGLRVDMDGGFKYSNLSLKSYKFLMDKIIFENQNKKVRFFIISDIVSPCDLFNKSGVDLVYVHEDDVTQMCVGIQCNYHILSASTFHYWIAVLSKNPTNVYVFNNTDITDRKLNFPEWKVIEQVEDDFVFLKSFDQSSCDLYNKNYSVPVLKELALKDSKCVAFNTMGWFKNEITSLSSCEVWGQNEGIYIKKEYYESLIKNNTIAKG